MFAETGGLHACGLFAADGTLLAAREDVGRHNALDKLVGWALSTAPAAPGATSMVSGRVGFEIVQKAIAAGIPIIAAVSAPSSLAVDLAERFGVTLAGFVRGESMNVYAHARARRLTATGRRCNPVAMLTRQGPRDGQWSAHLDRRRSDRPVKLVRAFFGTANDWPAAPSARPPNWRAAAAPRPDRRAPPPSASPRR